MSLEKYYNLSKKKLFFLNRSLTGKGTLKTLKIIKKEFPKFKIKKFRSGSKVFDWKIPPEWNVEDAYVLDKNNNKIIDIKKNNLHLIGYSTPINKTLKKREFFKHLHFLKEQPKAIPYITSYYKRRWGFCITYNEFKKFQKQYISSDKFKIVINSSLNNKGLMNYGELILKGVSSKEVLISTYICHPSMANDQLSGPIVAMALINFFSKKKIYKTLRFLFIPETIGSIAYIKNNLDDMKKNIIGGFNLSCIGDNKNHSCMLSKYADSPSDEAIIEAYKKLQIKKYKVHSFLERGSDERQYNSPGVDLKITSIFRTKYGEFPEYHTSMDNFNLVTLKGVKGGYKVAKKALEIIDENIYPKNNILGEPQMSKRGMYPTLSTKNSKTIVRHYMDFLQYADGKNSLSKISKYIKLDIKAVKKIYKILLKKKLLTC